MDLSDAVRTALARPTPESLRHVRTALLTADLDPDHPIHEVVCALHEFLVRWRSTVAAERHSESASRLDLAALAGLALEELSTAETSADVASRVLSGLVSEGLAFAATRQHVQAWRGEVNALLTETAWTLGGLLWSWSSRRRPDLSADERDRLVARLTEAVRTPSGDAGVRAVLATRLFQVMLLDESVGLENRGDANDDDAGDPDRSRDAG
jgi:hypothetical protein